MKKSVSFCMTALFLFGALSGCATRPVTPQPTPTPQAFAIEVKVDKPAYKIGELMYITVRASQACYLTLYDISTVGEVTQIFPNRFAKDNKIQGGVAYRIPTESDKFDFKVTGPAGIERVRAVGTMQNVNLFEEKQKQLDEDTSKVQVFPEITDKPAQFEKNLNDQLSVIPSAQWTEASVTFQVQ